MSSDPVYRDAVAWLAAQFARDGVKTLNLSMRKECRQLLWDRFEEIEDEHVDAAIDEALARAREPVRSPPPDRVAAGHNRRRPRPPLGANDEQLSAPYRFVVLNETVVGPQPETRDGSRMKPIPGGFCGHIEVEWAAETPLLVGAEMGTGDDAYAGPMRLGASGPYILPGTTLRGMVRAAAEIVAHGRLSQVNRHHRYGLRDFEHPAYRETDKQENRLDWSQVGSGWLARQPMTPDERRSSPNGSDYVLTPCDKRLIFIWQMPGAPALTDLRRSGEHQVDWLKKSLADKLEATGYSAEKKRRQVIYDFTKAFGFVDDPSQEHHVKSDKSGTLRATLVFSGRSPTMDGLSAQAVLDQRAEHKAGNFKKRECVFVDRPGAPKIRLTDQQFRQFELVHCKPSKNKPEPDGSYAVLKPTLDSGRRIPVFYTGDPHGSDFNMGLTRLFKIGHRYTVEDVLNRSAAHRIGARFAPDFVETLFGYVYEPDEVAQKPDTSVDPGSVSRKGRVSFGFARLDPTTPAVETALVRPVMMGPRASYAPFYLRGRHKDWSADDARLAGRKRYFPRFPRPVATDARTDVQQAILDQLGELQGNQNEKTRSAMKLLASQDSRELVFKGEIRLHNVTAAELGALLWVLTHGGDRHKPFRHMIGRAKTVGAGQVRTRALRLRLVGNDGVADGILNQDLEEWEKLVEGNDLETGWLREGHSMAPFLRAFEACMRASVSKWPDVQPVREWLAVCDPAQGRKIALEGRANYRPLKEFAALRKATKLATNLADNDAAEVRKKGLDRYLTTPELPSQALSCPYRTKS